MTTLKFKCVLLSDVILNQKAASEGQNKTLDFIPGSCFLGIAADVLYPTKDKEICRMMFHTGQVKFGDAHPVIKDAAHRSLKIPACYYYPKLKKLNEGSYISFFTDFDDIDIRKKQLKQCREGFFDVDESDKRLKKITVNTNAAIKSAYDRINRRSKDEMMYTYESLEKGLILYFEVVIEKDCEKYATDIQNALTVGEKRIGRSRTAQYGLVKISQCKFDEIPSRVVSKDFSVVYADSRLVFLDNHGLPTYQPSALDLGFTSDCEIDWELSQIRTFQYAPWNYTRQCFDADRCGIEKGSVIVVKSNNSPTESQYVGSYQNEGFGKVIYNPEFVLTANNDGLNDYDIILPKNKDNDSLVQKDKRRENCKIEINTLKSFDSTLLQYLAIKKQEELYEERIFEIVNNFVKDDKQGRLFIGESFASQWGAIRTIAMKKQSFGELETELFTKTHTVEKRDRNGNLIQKREPFAYLTHGVAMEKWKKKNRFDVFKKFFYELDQEGNFAQLVLINLAAQMAKQK